MDIKHELKHQYIANKYRVQTLINYTIKVAYTSGIFILVWELSKIIL